MRKLILKSSLAPGDLVMLSAAIRDLHRWHPGQFVTDVRTAFPDIWEHNPDITSLIDNDPEAEFIDCHYPLMHQCNPLPVHFLEGYLQFLNRHLGLHVRPTAFHGRIELSPREKRESSQVENILGQRIPFWIIDAGGKFDFTIKWWSTERWQAVVNELRHEVLFVQVGHALHFHPRLDGVLDLRGLTTLRQLIRLVHHADGIVCPVTALMHLAAAVPRPNDRSGLRPCVVVAGAREPSQWIAYPGHQLIHRVGTLPCCATGGCWRARTLPLGDGHPFDAPEQLCVNVVNDLPRCMDSIGPEQVIKAVRDYHRGGMARSLTLSQARQVERIGAVSRGTAIDLNRISWQTSRMAFDHAASRIGPYPGGFAGRGVVMLAVGWPYLVSAWVCLSRLRQTGCRLPVQLFHHARGDRVPDWIGPMEELGVEVIPLGRKIPENQARTSHPWALKIEAILACRFEEVLYLDADQVPLVDLEFYFDTARYRETGAVFWPDVGRWTPDHPMWRLTGLEYLDEPEVQGGDALLNKSRVWAPLQLSRWMNRHHEFYFQHMLGDKDTYRLAFRKLGLPFAMTSTPVRDLRGAFVQHDFDGRPTHQHRLQPKWTLDGPNPEIPGFDDHAACLEALHQLKTKLELGSLSPKVGPPFRLQDVPR